MNGTANIWLTDVSGTTVGPISIQYFGEHEKQGDRASNNHGNVQLWVGPTVHISYNSCFTSSSLRGGRDELKISLRRGSEICNPDNLLNCLILT